jgi:hypothetical protein
VWCPSQLNRNAIFVDVFVIHFSEEFSLFLLNVILKLYLTTHTKRRVKTEGSRHLLSCPNGQPTPTGMQRNLIFSLSIRMFSLFFFIPPSCLLPWPLTQSYKSSDKPWLAFSPDNYWNMKKCFVSNLRYRMCNEGKKSRNTVETGKRGNKCLSEDAKLEMVFFRCSQSSVTLFILSFYCH